MNQYRYFLFSINGFKKKSPFFIHRKFSAIETDSQINYKRLKYGNTLIDTK